MYLRITGDNWKQHLVEGLFLQESLIPCYVASAHVHENVHFRALKYGLASPSSIFTSLHSIMQPS